MKKLNISNLFLFLLTLTACGQGDPVHLSTKQTPQPIGPNPVDPEPSEAGYTDLVPKSWREGVRTASGYFLQDYSYAGYRNGKKDFQYVGVKISVASFGADVTGKNDSSAAFNKALTEAKKLNSQVTIFFPAGTYRLDQSFVIDQSNLSIRGEGVDKTQLHFKSAKSNGHISLHFKGNRQEVKNYPLTSDLEVFQKVIPLSDVTGLEAGHDIEIGQVITDDFINAHQMQGRWTVSKGQWRAFYQRTIVSVDTANKTVTIDVPIRYPMKKSDQASLKLVTGLLKECGMSDLSFSDVVDQKQAEKYNRITAVTLTNGSDCHFDRLQSYAADSRLREEIQSNGLAIYNSKRVTIDHVNLARVQNRLEGGNGYLFEISQSQEILVKNSKGINGRHNFIINWDFNTNGCVFHRVVSSEAQATNMVFGVPVTIDSSSDFHHSLALANLIDDSEINDGWSSINRQSYSSNAGQSGTQNVFWNNKGSGNILSYQYGIGYIIGSAPTLKVYTDTSLALPPTRSQGTLPNDLVLKRDETIKLQPSSLYEFQLQKRLQK